MCICVCHVWVCAVVSEGTCRVQKRVSDHMTLKLYTFMNHLLWMLGTKLRSSGTAANAFNC